MQEVQEAMKGLKFTGNNEGGKSSGGSSTGKERKPAAKDLVWCAEVPCMPEGRGGRLHGHRCTY